MEHETPSPTSDGTGIDRPLFGGNGATRRKFLAGAAAGTAVWAAPAIIKVSNAQAQASNLVTMTATSSLWKFNANPPTVAQVCATAPSGNANRGNVQFVIKCAPLPRTVTVTITINNGPALSGANAREVRLLQSVGTNASGTCLDNSVIGTYNSANGVPVTLGPIPLVAGATHFSLAMLQTGGGGTDIYTTNRVNIIC